MNDPLPEPANLRFLRRLVTVLTATMILGVLVIVALLVIRLQQHHPLPLPEQISLPTGAAALAITEGHDWFGVVTSDQHFLIFDKVTGQLWDSIPIKRPDSN